MQCARQPLRRGRGSTDLATWLAAPIDAVSLALPPAEVERVAMAAIKRGLPILAAKPVGADARAARTPVDDAPITFTGWGPSGQLASFCIDATKA
jgi:predicted dehydrogenase